MSPADPFQELAYFHRRMNRLLEESRRPARRSGAEALSEAAGAWSPKVNIFRLEEEILIQVELPGVTTRDEVSLELHDGVLSITGSRPAPGEGGDNLLSEGEFGPFRRLIRLPEGVDPARLSAQMRAGVLEIRLPKADPKGPQRVHIVELE